MAWWGYKQGIQKEIDRMSFKLKVFENGLTGMVAICDRCGKQVEDGEAMVAWTPKDNEKPNDVLDFKILCDGACLDSEDALCGHQYTQDLGTSIFFLMNNTNTKYKEAKQTAKSLSKSNPVVWIPKGCLAVAGEQKM
jgi:hypothetical protein